MTIFHHKLVAREGRVLANGWTRPCSPIIHDNICPLIHNKWHPESYHSGIKYHITLNIIFSVVFHSERRQITLYHIDLTMHIHLYNTHLYSPQLPTSGLPFQNITKMYREFFFYEGGPHHLIEVDKGKSTFPSSTSVSFLSSYSLFLSSFLPCAFPWDFPCPHVCYAHWNYSSCQDCGCVFYGQSRGMHVWNNETMNEKKTDATTALDIPF